MILFPQNAATALRSLERGRGPARAGTDSGKALVSASRFLRKPSKVSSYSSLYEYLIFSCLVCQASVLLQFDRYSFFAVLEAKH